MVSEVEIREPIRRRADCAVLHLLEMRPGRAIGPEAVVLRHPKQGQPAIVLREETVDASPIRLGESAQQIEQRGLTRSRDAKYGGSPAANVECGDIESRTIPTLDTDIFEMPQPIALRSRSRMGHCSTQRTTSRRPAARTAITATGTRIDATIITDSGSSCR